MTKPVCDHEFIDAWDPRVRDLHEHRGPVCVKCFETRLTGQQKVERIREPRSVDDNLREVFGSDP